MTRLVSRRGLIGAATGLAASGAGTGAYAVVVEPRMRLEVARYALTPPRWTPGLKLRLAILADLHGREPNMGVRRIEQAMETAQSLSPDLILLLGDYAQRVEPQGAFLSFRQVITQLSRLKAPLGVHGILGNHEWWDDRAAQRAGKGPTEAHRLFAELGMSLLDNRAIRLTKDGKAFWLAGLGDQLAIKLGHKAGYGGVYRGADDLPGTMAQITDDAPVVMMAHEPDIFPRMPERVSLTLSGHTHGGQVRLFGWSPVVPSEYGNRYAYGHVVENDRHLIVSGGLGTVSAGLAPVRLGVPPEIVQVDLG
ncbi:metallophosphoesterase [Terrirubrum flagellatum]|uniref:metallophosphoesterase n=1 Tax=Terrirubrum flagellatum TaxID=2895980 RepID=UPI003CC81339